MNDTFYSPMKENLKQMTPLISPENKTLKKKIPLKYSQNCIISLLIFLICLIDLKVDQFKIYDLSDPIEMNSEKKNEFNITDISISISTCQNSKLISAKNIKNYFSKINEYKVSSNNIKYYITISFISSLILLIYFYILKLFYEKDISSFKYIKILPFAIGVILFLNEFIVFIGHIKLYLLFYEITNYIQNCIKSKCIILLTWNYSIKVLQQYMNIYIIFCLFEICGLQLIIYFIKQLIIFNNFFRYRKNESKIVKMTNIINFSKFEY